MRTHFEIATSPHIKRPLSTDQIMRGVALSLLPVVGGALYYFGLGALLVILSGTAACMVAEASLQRLSGRPCTLGDGSALVTGLLFALTLPPALPLWMAALGGAIAILVVSSRWGAWVETCSIQRLSAAPFCWRLFRAP